MKRSHALPVVAAAAVCLMTALFPLPCSAAEGMAPGGADQAMMSGMSRMQQQMEAAPMTGNADHDFVAMMTPHHAGAIDMAKVELRYGHDPELRRMARDIIAAQQREIGQMNAWMAAHPTR